MPVTFPGHSTHPFLHKIIPFWLVGLILSLSACSPGEPGVPATRSASAAASSPTPEAAFTSQPTRTPPASTPTPQEQVALTDEDLRGAVIHFWHAWSGDGGRVVKELVDEFNLSNRWSILVVPVVQGSLDELYANLDTALAQRNPPDLVTAYLHQAIRWQAGGKLVDLEIYANDPKWGMSPAEQADFYPAFWDQDIIAGQRLGIPAQRSGQLLYYNLSWAQALGFNLPPSRSEIFALQACTAFEANQKDEDPGNDSLGGWIIAGGDRPDYSAMLAWIYAFGGDVFLGAGGSPLPTGLAGAFSPYRFDTPQVEEAFTFLRGLFDDGCARFAADAQAETEFAARSGLFSTGSVMHLPYQVEAFRQAGNRDNWTVIPFPSPGYQPAIAVYGPSFEIFNSSPKEQLAAWVFIQWMVSPENQARLVQATSAFPTRRSVLDHLESYQQRNPQWAAAAQLLESARAEPPFQSWSTVRWALSDASTQLFRSYFTIDQVSTLLNLLEQTAAELHLGPHLEDVFATPVPAAATPSP